MLFIGIQAYTPCRGVPRLIKGAAIIVFAFQGGMISGMAIGPPPVSYLEPHGVFLVSGAIGLAAAA